VVFLLEQSVTKEEIIAAVQECTRKMGRVPSFPELQLATKVTNRMMRMRFGNYSRTLQACGLTREGAGVRVSMRTLFDDWAELVRKLGKIPTIMEYTLHSNYSVRPFIGRFKGWMRVPEAMNLYCRREGLADEYKDVMDIIAVYLEMERGGTKIYRSTSRTGAEAGSLNRRAAIVFTDRPVCGRPLHLTPLNCAPINEMGVVFLFGAMALQLGFSVTQLQAAFPDCEALRELKYDKWQRVRIEFEYESRNFLLHGHPMADCDLIVCWNHNWEECPLEVLELKSVLGLNQLSTAEAAEKQMLTAG
jgi:hypothetical protein